MTNTRSDCRRRISDHEWREDLHFMVTNMKSIHPNLFHTIPEDTFNQEFKKLESAIPHLTDNEIMSVFLKLTALTQDWHTQIISRNLTEKWFPIRIEQFQDGFFITAISPIYAKYLGAKVLRIGYCSAVDAFEKVQTVTAHDNIYSRQYFSLMFLSMPSILNGLHILDDVSQLELALQLNGDDGVNISIPAIEFKSDDDLSWYWKKESAPAQECVTAAEKVIFPPAYWRNTELNYWFEYMEHYKTIYCAFNMTLNAETESFADFNSRLWKHFDSQGAKRLVVDLRHNLGGNRDILPPLYENIRKHNHVNRRGSLFVLIGPKNVSASSHCVAWFEQKTQAILIGTPTGARVNQYADPEHLRLPNSKLRLMIPKYFWKNSENADLRKWIDPHLYADFGSNDYFSLNDPALKLVLRYS